MRPTWPAPRAGAGRRLHSQTVRIRWAFRDGGAVDRHKTGRGAGCWRERPGRTLLCRCRFRLRSTAEWFLAHQAQRAAGGGVSRASPPVSANRRSRAVAGRRRGKHVVVAEPPAGAEHRQSRASWSCSGWRRSARGGPVGPPFKGRGKQLLKMPGVVWRAQRGKARGFRHSQPASGRRRQTPADSLARRRRAIATARRRRCRPIAAVRFRWPPAAPAPGCAAGGGDGPTMPSAPARAARRQRHGGAGQLAQGVQIMFRAVHGQRPASGQRAAHGVYPAAAFRQSAPACRPSRANSSRKRRRPSRVQHHAVGVAQQHRAATVGQLAGQPRHQRRGGAAGWRWRWRRA